MPETDFQYALALMVRVTLKAAGLDHPSSRELERREQALPWLRDGRD